MIAVTNPIPTTEVINLNNCFKFSSSLTIPIILASVFFISLSIAARELFIVLADGVNRGVGLDKSPAQRAGHILVCVFQISHGDVAGRLLAGLLPDGMPAHPIRHDEDMPFGSPTVLALREDDRVRILVVAAPDADVAEGGIFDGIESDHGYHTWTGTVPSSIMLRRGAPDATNAAPRNLGSGSV